MSAAQHTSTATGAHMATGARAVHHVAVAGALAHGSVTTLPHAGADRSAMPVMQLRQRCAMLQCLALYMVFGDHTPTGAHAPRAALAGARPGHETAQAPFMEVMNALAAALILMTAMWGAVWEQATGAHARCRMWFRVLAAVLHVV